MKALIEGVAFTLSRPYKPVVLRTLMKRLKINDPSVAEEGYQDLVKTVSRKPYASVDGMFNIQRLMRLSNPDIGNVKIENLVDNRIVRKLDESGFVDRLYTTYGVK